MNYKGEDSPSVLLVDDEQANRIVFQRTFGDHFRVQLAASGLEALEKMSLEQPAVVVCDMRMPGMLGTEVLERVRALYPDTMRVILSAFTDPGPLLDAINKSGASRYLVKPWDKREMMAVLAGAVDAFQLNRKLRQLELKLVEAQRFSTLGMLTANVAHDMASPVSVIVSNLERLREHAQTLATLRERRRSGGEGAWSEAETEAAEELVDITRDVEECSQYLADLVSGMRVHARAELPDEGADPRATIAFAAALVRQTVMQRGGRLEITTGQLPPVKMSSTQLCQVLVNLLSNAAHALAREQPERKIDVQASLRDRGVEFSIADTGKGIPAEILARVGHERVTTKPAGEGSGLGLTICRELVLQAGGQFRIESTVGQGTRVVLWIPEA